MPALAASSGPSHETCPRCTGALVAVTAEAPTATGWHPVADDIGEQLEVITETYGDRQCVVVRRSIEGTLMISMTADGADELADELRRFAVVARASAAALKGATAEPVLV